jgi:hypothetical protein
VMSDERPIRDMRSFSRNARNWKMLEDSSGSDY